MKKPLLIAVVGPTAIGKTTLAINLAQHFSTEIISADSRQFFKEMTIGTAVPFAEELKAAPHHFIQTKSITEAYSVGDFEKEAIALLDQLYKKHKVVIMVGGSGLYVDAVVNGLDTFPEVPENIRKDLNQELQTNGIENLQKLLEEIDPDYYHKIDPQNPRRLTRALEVYRASGKPYSSFLRKHETQREFDTLFIGLSAERAIMYNRINKRVDIMMGMGLLEEAKSLRLQQDLNALQTVGYRELFKYLNSDWEFDTAISEIKKNTRRFAKRQMTWFKKNEEIAWFDYQVNPKQIFDYIHKKAP